MVCCDKSEANECQHFIQHLKVSSVHAYRIERLEIFDEFEEWHMIQVSNTM